MLVHGVKGGLGPKLQGSHGTGQHPQHCQHHPQDADDAGEWGDHTIGGGGYVAQGLVHIYIYIHIYSIMCIYMYLPTWLVWDGLVACWRGGVLGSE